MRPSILLLALSIVLVPGRVRAAPEGDAADTGAPTAAEDASDVLAAAEECDAHELIAPRAFAIGLSGLGGVGEGGRGGLVPTFSAGLDHALTLHPWVRVAIRRIGDGRARTIDGDRHAVSRSPAVEVAIPVAEWAEPFAQGGPGVAFHP